VGYYHRLLKIEIEVIGSRAWAITIKLNFFKPFFITLYYHDFYKNRDSKNEKNEKIIDF